MDGAAARDFKGQGGSMTDAILFSASPSFTELTSQSN
jgi:hypothetical protein